MKNKDKITGIIKVTSKPIGFLLDQKNGQNIVVFEENLNCALDKDRVEVEIVGRDKERVKGKVLRVIERSKTEFVGTFERMGRSLKFVPDDFRFYKKIDIHNFSAEAKVGFKALVRVKHWNNPNSNPQGEIIKIIGEKGEHETEMQSILLDKGIIYDFPKEVEEEAQRVAKEFKTRQKSSFSESPRISSLRSARLSSKDFFAGRRDFRNSPTFTIDPVEAKDFDDALSYREIDDKKIEVGVHIADVSYFVRPGSALDNEARKRAFSTYLVDRTIPMLPEVLSNDLCSLVPGEDRFAFSAVFEIEKESGEILSRWFGRTIINSDKRFSYEEAQQTLESRIMNYELWKKKYGKELEVLNNLANIYRKENKKNGAIEFETDEVRFELDAEGKPLKVYIKSRLETMKMIEEWMLLANREVAKFITDKLKKSRGASIFRVHALPKMDKIEELAVFVRALGHELPIKNGEVDAKDINQLLQKIEGHASESLIKTAAIRAMAKAEYSTRNIGHFGLAFEYYTHFTSPIRRYPDLMVHRILDHYINNKPIPKNELARFEKIALETSEKEIAVAEAERESIKYKQVEYMKDKVGKEFEAVISGVTEWGMYVENPETKSEGLIHLKNLTDDRYELDQKNYCLVGSRTRRKYSLGDSVRVRLISADLDRKTLDFKLV